LEHVAGYCLHNDYSERAYQFERGGQWVMGKLRHLHSAGPGIGTGGRGGSAQPTVVAQGELAYDAGLQHVGPHFRGAVLDQLVGGWAGVQATAIPEVGRCGGVWNRRTRGGAAAHYGLCRPTPGAPKHGRIRRGPQATNRLIFCYLGLKKASSLRVWRLLVRQIRGSTACEFGVY